MAGQSAARRAETRRGETLPAAELPVARVCVDVPLAHLDRLFDYQVPEKFAESAVPGCRVRVRFAGQLVDGYLIDRVATSGHPGKLGFLHAVVSAEAVLNTEITALARLVADRYAGNLIDVLRLAIPPRHARVEAQPPRETAPPPEAPAPACWDRYRHGAAYLDALRAGKQAHAVWQALPGEDWPARLAEAAATVASTGRGAVLVLPDHRDVQRVSDACTALAGDTVVSLSADLGPAERYRRWLAVRRGAVRIVVGTRATMFAPVADPGLLVVWDDGDDLHAEPRAPYPHTRDVLVQRAHHSGASLLLGAFARTAEAQLLVDSGWAHHVGADRDALRAAAPRVVSLGETDVQLARDPAARAARLPAIAFDAARAALADGAPVLVQVPRRGYVPAVACARCRTPARCRRCAGPLGLPGAGAPVCRWCGVTEGSYSCQACGEHRLRAMVVGARRTAEELGRAFPGTTVRTSGAGEVLATIPPGPALVVCTPGAEPFAAEGYGAVLLLDGWALLSRADLRAAEEALRRWMSAAALARPGIRGGRVVVMAESVLAPVQALVRWDPVWHAAQELAARTELGFPPAVRMASLEGAPDALATLLDTLTLPGTGEILGPVPTQDEHTERALIRVRREEGRALAAVLHAAVSTRTARKDPDIIRVRLDPLELV